MKNNLALWHEEWLHIVVVKMDEFTKMTEHYSTRNG
jgi:hypothetical protein